MPNPDITYIRNLREKQNYVCALHLMKTYIMNSETETKLFLCPSTSSDMDGCAAVTSAHIYARGGSFFELGINGNLGWGTVGESFFCFCQKNKNGNLGWETFGDAQHSYRVYGLLIISFCVSIYSNPQHLKLFSQSNALK